MKQGIAQLAIALTALAAPAAARAQEPIPNLAGSTPQQRPGQLRLRHPAVCEPDMPAVKASPQQRQQDGGGMLLRQLFDGLGAWQCGWEPRQPRWHGGNVTLWGGAMTEGNMGESLLFSEGFRSEALAGLGVQGTLWQRGRLGLVVDANLIGHRGLGGRTPRQTFAEVTLGLGLKLMPNDWLAITVVEGLSAYSERSAQALEQGGNGRRLVNYLALEVDAAMGEQLSLVLRLHHRSGIYGTISCGTACDTNGYLLGLRYHFSPRAARPAGADAGSAPADSDATEGATEGATEEATEGATEGATEEAEDNAAAEQGDLETNAQPGAAALEQATPLAPVATRAAMRL